MKQYMFLLKNTIIIRNGELLFELFIKIVHSALTFQTGASFLEQAMTSLLLKSVNIFLLINFQQPYKYSLSFMTDAIVDDSYFLTQTPHCQHNFMLEII